MKLYLREELQAAWQGKDPFEQVTALKGEVFREVKERTTLRFELNGKSYFLKLHRGIGWGEIFKNWTQFNRPVLGAEQEYQAILKLQQLNVETMNIAGFGEMGSNPAKKLSFIITDDLVDTANLEDYCRLWSQQPPAPTFKRLLIERVARMSRTLHENGLNHRDYYICHFHLHLPSLPESGPVSDEHVHLHLIDLHRMQQHENMPIRWAVKDIGGLYFSALEIGLTKRDVLRFMCLYRSKTLREMLAQDQNFWRAVEQRAQQLYAKGLRKGIVGNIAQHKEMSVALSSRELIDAGRELKTPFEIELELAGDVSTAQCVELLRLVPGRRVVVKMLVGDQVFLGKIFLGADAGKYRAREQAGIVALQATGIQTAKLIEQAQLSDSGGEVLMMEYLPDVTHLSERVDERSENSELLLDSAVEMLAELHIADLQHKDCHLDNFLVTEKGLYLVDGDAVSKKIPLSQAQALENLALFFVQLPLFLLPRLPDLLASYCRFRGWDKSICQVQLDAQVKQQRASRQRRFLKKIYRDCTQFKVEQCTSRFEVLDREQEAAELTELVNHLDQHIADGELLKDGNSATVAKVMVGGKSFVVKRYNIKSFVHWLKRCWRPSRAWLSWRNAQLLSFYGVATPKPLAMVEHRWLGLRGRAYFITEYADADDAIAYVKRAKNDPARLEWLAQQFAQLFKTMALLKISHGDLKGTNFLIENNQLSVIDLDSMRLHNADNELGQALAKDKRRYLKNWGDKTAVFKVMAQAIRDT